MGQAPQMHDRTENRGVPAAPEPENRSANGMKSGVDYNIAVTLHALMVAILIGERPGLGPRTAWASTSRGSRGRNRPLGAPRREALCQLALGRPLDPSQEFH